MAVPSAPFALSSDVAPYLAQRLSGRGDFEDGVTGIPKTSVDVFIVDVSSQMLARFRLAGYITPLTTNGETWPDNQTDFLRTLAVMGVCSILNSPFVENPARRSGDGNSFKTMYESGLDEIYDRRSAVSGRRSAGPFFGCLYRSMTPAERAVAVPAVPTTSWLLETYDPALHSGFQYWTDLSQRMQDYMEDTLQLIHNYDYDLNSLEKGPYV
jgi:hypothetical protein